MAKPSSHGLFQALIASSIFLLALISPLAAQESSSHAFSSGTDGVPFETASLASLPAAPSALLTESGAPESAGAAPMVSMAVVAAPSRPAEHTEHRFWDRQNCILFAAAGGMATADFFVTRSNLAHGGRELNPVTSVFAGSTPALAANFALETGGVIGLSYMFHKTGHHKLERATAFINIGASASAVGYGMSHR